MSNMNLVQLGKLAGARLGSIVPNKTPDEIFDLYSIPAYDQGSAQLTLGAEIGSAKQLVQEGDVLLSKIVPHIRRSWVVGPSRGHRQIASGEWLVYRSNDAAPDYLRHALVSDQFHRSFMATVAGVGGSLLRARPTHVNLIRIPLPPLPEQRRIAAILDLSDRLISDCKSSIVKLDDIVDAAFDQYASGVETDSWEIRSVSEACIEVVDCVNKTAPTVEGPTNYKMIRTTNVKDGYVRTASVRYVDADTFERWTRRVKPKIDDVLLTREAPVGQVGIVETDDRIFLGQRLMLYRANCQVVLPGYLRQELRSPFVQRQFERSASGSTVKHLPLPICRNFEIRIPPMHIQDRFVEKARCIEEIKERKNLMLCRLNHLNQSIKSRAFRTNN